MNLELAGKRVFVSGGGGRNMGRAITLELAREGANVAAADVDLSLAEEAAEEAKKEKVLGEVTPILMDVTKFDEVERAVQEATEKLGGIDILVNVAGTDVPMLFLETTPDFWDWIINLNYKGVIHTMKAVLPQMVERGKGTVVSIASDAGRLGEYKEAVYGGAKAGVISLTRSIVREYGPKGIRANVICPGMTFGFSKEEAENIPMVQNALKRYPLRKIGHPTDIAFAVAFLSSDRAAGHIAGQTLSVSGGYSMY